MRTHRCLRVVGAALMLGAVLSLIPSMQLSEVDGNGRPLSCGSAWHPDRAQVSAQDQLNHWRHDQDSLTYELTDYLGACSGWIDLRRRTALAVGVTGVVLLALAEGLVRRVRRRAASAVPSGADITSGATPAFTARAGDPIALGSSVPAHPPLTACSPWVRSRTRPDAITT